MVSTTVQAIYSDTYNDELSKLTSTDPNKSLIMAQEVLEKAQLNKDIHQQLIALFYITWSYSLLSDHEKVNLFVEKGLVLAEKYNDLRFKSEFLGLKAYQQMLTGDNFSANMNANQALQLARETDDSRLIANQLSFRGSVHTEMENYDLAIIDIGASIEIFKQHHDNDNLSSVYNSLAIVYHHLNDYDNAIKYYQESDAYESVKSPYGQAILLYNIGTAYAAKKNNKLAIEYFNKSIKLSSQTGDKYIKALANFGMVEVLMTQGKIDQAEALLLPMFEVFESNKDTRMILFCNLTMAEIKISKQLFSLALMYLNLADEQSKIINTPSIRLKYLDMKIQYFSAQNMWKQAFEIKNQTSLLKSEAQERNKDKLVEELRVKFNVKFGQEKLELLQMQNKLQHDIIVQGKSKQKYLWSLIILSLFVLGITYYGYRNQRKVKRQLYKSSITDYLTRVANRRQIILRLKEVYLQSTAGDLDFGLIMVDLDYFKKINDNYGHDIGNEVLIYFAKEAQRIFLGIGEVGRIGGEEWLILLPSITIDVIKEKLQELRESYNNCASLKIPSECNLSFSSGVVMYSGQYLSHEKMLRDVDIAMYQAKQNGRGQDIFF